MLRALFLTMLFATCAYAQIDAPSQCVVGELVVLQAQGEGIAWAIHPVTPDFRVFGNVAVFSGREISEYLIMVATVVDGNAELQTHTIKVVEFVDDLQNDIIRAVKAVKYDTPEAKKAVLLKLENVFRTLSNSNTDDLLRATAKSIKDLLGDEQPKWEPMLDIIGNCLDAKKAAGKLETKEDYQVVWVEVADALKKAATNEST